MSSQLSSPSKVQARKESFEAGMRTMQESGTVRDIWITPPGKVMEALRLHEQRLPHAELTAGSLRM